MPHDACPIPNAHRRLMDCHEHWHVALDEYNDPDGFRLALNALVQGLRNVTWVLQKQKADIPDFATWYAEWQTSVKGNPVMGWVVKARNRIVKEADLELNSSARVVVDLDWVHQRELVLDVPPRWGPAQIASVLAAKGALSTPEGECLITVERRWVDRLLPDVELLDACAEAYEELRSLLQRAHAAFGVEACSLQPRKRECVTADLSRPFHCNWRDDGGSRRMDFDASTFARYVPASKRIERDESWVPSPLFTERLKDIKIAGDAIDNVPNLLKMGQVFLEADDGILPAVWYFRGDKVVDLQLHQYVDQAAKRIAMRAIAANVRRLRADGVMMLNEVWVAVATDEDFARGAVPPARHHPDRTEALQALGVTADGRVRIQTIGFRKSAEAVDFDEMVEERSMVGLNLLRPILAVWGIDPPPLE